MNLRHAVITGAAGGIGQALVQAFNEAGYAVIATDVVPQPAGLACALYLQVDLARTVQDEAYAADVFARIHARTGLDGLAALINNAAVQILGGVDSLTRADWQQTLQVNLQAPFIWTQALLPALEAAKGSVVNISSIHARLTKKNFVAYATSKAALSGMTRAMAVDLGGRVRVNAIEPAAIETEMLKAGFKGDSTGYEALELCHPIGRIGSPYEVADVTLALIKGPEFLTGTCVALDGAVGNTLHDPVENKFILGGVLPATRRVCP
jgi:NAD(P)-dependent dehydrogenase (short-subunit alcohol dehydrogenase family)